MNNELVKRVLVALVGIPFGVYVILEGGLFFTFFIAIISTMGLNEFYKMIENKGFKPYKYIFLIFNFIMTLITGYLLLNDQFVASMIFFIGNALFILIFSFLYQLWDHTDTPIENNMFSIVGFLYVGILFICLLFIREFGTIREYMHNLLPFQINDNVIDSSVWGKLLLIHISSIWICDSMAYFVGKSFGKHKLFERHSPKKSVEGAIGGFLSSIIYFILMLYFYIPEINYLFGIGFGLIVGIFGQLGDLVESHFKRYSGVKDSSNLIPGHGGILDRFDSIMFTSPLLLIYIFLILFLM